MFQKLRKRCIGDKRMHASPWAKLSMDLDALVCMHRLRRLLEVNFVSPSKLRCCANSLKQFTYPSFAWLLLPGVDCLSVYAGAVFAPTYPVWQAPTKSTGRKASPYRATIDASSRIYTRSHLHKDGFPNGLREQQGHGKPSGGPTENLQWPDGPRS